MHQVGSKGRLAFIKVQFSRVVLPEVEKTETVIEKPIGRIALWKKAGSS